MSFLTAEVASEANHASLSDQQREILTIERQALADYFEPVRLRLENLPDLIAWLQATPAHYLAEPREWVARFLIESYRALNSEQKTKFIADLRTWLGNSKNRTELDAVSQGPAGDLPPLADTVEATIERLEKIEKIEKAWFKSGASAISVGGSMSYGPFYNIKKNQFGKSGSDIDVVVVVDRPNQIIATELAVNLSTLGAEQAEVEALTREWEKCWASTIQSSDIFTSKLTVATQNEQFEVSFHVFSEEAYARLTDPTTSASDMLIAYRTRPFKHTPVHTSLAGEQVPLTVNNTVLDSGAYLMGMNAWPRDSKGVFTPNMYHNMILPNADMSFNPAVQSSARDNTNRLLDHVYQNLELSDIALSHLRSEIISPFLHYHLRNKQV